MKIYKIIIVLFLFVNLFSKCHTKSLYKDALASLSMKGYVQYDYTFSDRGTRNLCLKFQNDSTLSISNRVSSEHAPSYYLWNFDVSYKIVSSEFGIFVIQKALNTNKLFSSNYVKPYRRDKFKSVESLFPNIVGDTIFLSSDFTKIQIKEFVFDVK